MRRLIRTTVILVGIGLLAGLYLGHKIIPVPRIKAPTTRYHGYDLNREAIDKVRSQTVLISNEGFAGIGRGTGVLIDSTHVLTCAHMLEGPADDMWIYPYPGSVVLKGRPVYASRNDDLAVIEISSPVALSHYAVFQEAHYDGEPITIIGNTLGAMRWFVTFGIVSGEWQGYILTDGVLYGGNSGGPWLNEKGEIVAITDWTLSNRHNEHMDIHGGVSAAAVRGFLHDWKNPSLLSILLGMSGDRRDSPRASGKVYAR